LYLRFLILIIFLCIVHLTINVYESCSDSGCPNEYFNDDSIYYENDAFNFEKYLNESFDEDFDADTHRRFY
jgi:hypothetical protein